MRCRGNWLWDAPVRRAERHAGRRQGRQLNSQRSDCWGRSQTCARRAPPPLFHERSTKSPLQSPVAANHCAHLLWRKLRCRAGTRGESLTIRSLAPMPMTLCGAASSPYRPANADECASHAEGWAIACQSLRRIRRRRRAQRGNRISGPGHFITKWVDSPASWQGPARNARPNVAAGGVARTIEASMYFGIRLLFGPSSILCSSLVESDSLDAPQRFCFFIGCIQLLQFLVRQFPKHNIKTLVYSIRMTRLRPTYDTPI